ncbi:hypothetical protein AACH06_19170 [Ideonella sp. DXS29W]|uniref:Uncharacterized protein n=1 Tax=Ideonella lacteola TaxID=2984193 RepID=A0ABU9BSJ7_9BURK
MKDHQSVCMAVSMVALAALSMWAATLLLQAADVRSTTAMSPTVRTDAPPADVGDPGQAFSPSAFSRTSARS